MLIEKDQPILDKIKIWKKEAKEYREQYEPEWKECERFYVGEQWKFTERKPVKNWVFTTIEGEVPILTDSRPAANVIPQEENQEEQASILDSALQYVYDDQNIQLKIAQVIRSALKIGTAYHYVDFDPSQEDGQGRITIKELPWTFVYLDPAASEVDECSYAFIDMPIRRDELIRRFPDYEEQINELTGDFGSIYNSVNEFIDPTKWDGIGGIDRESSKSKSRFNSRDMLLITESWIKDFSMEPVPEDITTAEIAKEADQFIQAINPDVGRFEDHNAHLAAHEDFKKILVAEAFSISPDQVNDAILLQAKSNQDISLILEIINDHIEIHKIYHQENPKGERPVYKNNLRLVINCEDVVVYDGPAPVDDGLIPLNPYYCYKDAEIYGTGEVKNILPAQRSYNEMDYAEYKGLRLNANSGWIKDANSGVDETTLTNEEGIVVTKNAGTECRRLEPGQVSPQLSQRKQIDQQAIDRISGVNESTQGVRPTGVTAASAIRFLQQQSVGRIRLKTRMLEEYSLLRLAKLILSRIVKYWTTERLLRIYDADGRIKYVKFEPDIIRNLNYEVKAVPGTSSGLDKEAIFNVTSGLLDKGIISPKLFVQINDLPYKAAILKELEEKEQQQMMMAQQMAIQAGQIPNPQAQLNQDNLIMDNIQSREPAVNPALPIEQRAPLSNETFLQGA